MCYKDGISLYTNTNVNCTSSSSNSSTPFTASTPASETHTDEWMFMFRSINGEPLCDAPQIHTTTDSTGPSANAADHAISARQGDIE